MDGTDEFGANKEGVNRKSAKEKRGECAYVCVEGESGLVKKSEWAKMLPQRAVEAVFA